MGREILNYTAEPIELRRLVGPPLVLSSIGVARVATSVRPVVNRWGDEQLVDAIPLVDVARGEVVGLPAPSDHLLVVDDEVLVAVETAYEASAGATRTPYDLGAPANPVRDGQGRVVAYRALRVRRGVRP